MGCLDANEIKKKHTGLTLYHFTQADNLDNIFKYGLMPRTDLDLEGIKYAPNDANRIEGHLNSISLSISWPNYKMLYLQKNKPENKGKVWAVLEINPYDVLCDENIPCAYYWTNAADGRMRHFSPTQLSSAECFEALFGDNPLEIPQGYHEPRMRRKSLYPSHPTNPQAEILAFHGIKSSSIQNIYLANNQENLSSGKMSLMEYLERYTDYMQIIPQRLRDKFQEEQYFKKRQMVFRSRYDYKDWT